LKRKVVVRPSEPAKHVWIIRSELRSYVDLLSELQYNSLVSFGRSRVRMVDTKAIDVQGMQRIDQRGYILS